MPYRRRPTRRTRTRRPNILNSRRHPFRKAVINRQGLALARKALAQSGVHYFKRQVDYPNISSSILDVSGSYVFRLTDIPVSTEFTNLFDSYRIHKVVLDFFPTKALTDTNTAADHPLRFYAAIDHDDENTVSRSDIQQYHNMKVRSSTRSFSIVIKPKVSTATYLTPVTTGYQTPTRAVWVDCGQASIPHYGLKWVLEGHGGSSYAPGFKVSAKYYFSFKAPR